MSSLIFYTNKEDAFVATDTLATLCDGTPFMFTTKAFIVPHLRMIMCGTGAGGFLGRWFIQVNDMMIIRGIDHLDYHTPKNLMAFWQGHKKEFPEALNLTITVYHFGFSELDGLIHSYAYRSTNDFRSEPIEYGIGVKPTCKIPEDLQLPRDIKRMMDDQRLTQASLPKNERLYIGGEIVIHHLTRTGYYVFTLGQFEDFEVTERAIYQNFPNISR